MNFKFWKINIYPPLRILYVGRVPDIIDGNMKFFHDKNMLKLLFMPIKEKPTENTWRLFFNDEKNASIYVATWKNEPF